MASSKKTGYIYFSIVIPIFIFIVLAAGLKPSNVNAENRSFHFPSVTIEAEILSCGSMEVIEERTFRFDGVFRGAWQYIYLDNKINIKDIQVGELNRPYREEEVGTQDIPGVFFVEEEPNRTYIDWSFEAEDEDRTFIISYTVENAVIVHEDTAELYWQFIGDEWTERTDQARVTLTLPGETKPEDIMAWGHGPLHGEVKIATPGVINWTVDGLPTETYLEGRVLFPTSLVPLAENLSGEEALSSIIAEEDALSARANFERNTFWLFLFFAPLPPLIYGLYRYYVKKEINSTPDAYKGDYYRELPADYSPAEAGCLIRKGKVTPADFTATLLDLARRGHINLEDTDPEADWEAIKSNDYRVIPMGETGNLKQHENKLYNFIFNTVGSGDDRGTTLRAINDYARNNRQKAANFFKQWEKIVQKETATHRFFKSGSKLLVAITALLGIFCFFLLLYIIILMNMMNEFTNIGLVLFAGGLALYIAVPYMIYQKRRLTPSGAEHYSRWSAFKRFLEHFSNLDRATIPSLKVWEHYLVYAVSLGVADRVIDQLQLVYPSIETDRDTWFGYRRHSASRQPLPERLTNMRISIQRSFTSARQIATATSSSSSSSSSGGGFSSGGGGGFGGGGGGAR